MSVLRRLTLENTFLPKSIYVSPLVSVDDLLYGK